jgi:hypothetical protein
MTQCGHHSFVLIIGINVCKVAIAGIRVSVSPVRASEFEALIYANFKHPFIEYIAMSALRLDLSLAQQKTGILLVTFHKRILEWQADHPNITWAGWGIVWAIVLVLLFWPRPSE